MQRVVLAAVVLVGLGLAQPALAQYKTVSVHLGGAGSFPQSDSRDSFKDGWGFVGGVTWHATERFGLELDYSYNRHGLKGELFQVTTLDGSHSLQNIDVNAVYYTGGSDRSSLYLLGGGGAYRRNVEITNFEGYAGGIICNPWWFICYPGSVPVESVLGSRSRWDPGIDVGLGYQFSLGGDSKLFLEGRYHYVFGDRVEGASGEPLAGNRNEKATGQYLQIRAGFRF